MKAPKGKLIAIGGGEDKERNMMILKRFVEECGGPESVIEIITTATNLPKEVGEDYTEAFKLLECKHFNFIHIEERENANDPKIIGRLEKAAGILFTGGAQLKLSTLLGGTDFLKTIRERYLNEHFIVAGTSAGAAAMSNTMIMKGSSEASLLKGELQMTTGLGFLQDVIIDTHFTERGRFGRLIQAVSTNPSCIGIGLGEDTAVIISGGNNMVTIGSGLVIIIDGQDIKYTNLTEIADGEPLSVEQVNLHVLSQGDKFILDEKKIIHPKKRD